MFHILFHTCFIRVSYHTIARPDIHPSIGGGTDPFSDGLGLRNFRICNIRLKEFSGRLQACVR